MILNVFLENLDKMIHIPKYIILTIFLLFGCISGLKSKNYVQRFQYDGIVEEENDGHYCKGDKLLNIRFKADEEVFNN